MSSSESQSDNDDEAPGLFGQILPYLYIGDAAAACDTAQCKEFGITRAVNCSSLDVEFDQAIVSSYSSYTALPIAEAIDEDIEKYFDEAYEAIITAKNQETKVLVFCEDGCGRSACIVIAYMMMASEKQNKKLPLSMALKHLDSKWEHSNINAGFLSKLVALEKQLYGEVSIRLAGKGEKHSGGGRGGGSSRGRGGSGRGRGDKRKRGK
uniref:protein-tyrosine-phosphatase n=1 Tax=Spongospora subterranea TaxID=70186 RepID=A0A0H5QN03_9EUKA|eukprot:CRZ02932.1 hypothetical protein [Spongospora subterranea]